MLCHWCFWFTMNALMCEARKMGECVDKKGVMVEEWKTRRKEWKKKRWKKGKGKKWFWEKSFLFLFDCVFASSLFPLALTHHHTTTPQHTLTLNSPHHTTRCIGAHRHMQTGPCAGAAENMAPSNRTVMTSFSFLQLEDFYYPIAFSMTSPNFLQFAV